MSKYLGLDIGAATVGFSLVDIDEKKIIHAGTSIFPKADPSHNQDRRASRGRRRSLRRKSYRVIKTDRLIKKFKINEDYSVCTRNPYEIKVDALNNQISEEELAYILKHYVKHRGIDYLSEEDENETKKNGIKYDNGTEDTRYICEKELERLINFFESEQSGERIDNLYNIGIRNGGVLYSKFDYKKEIEHILNTQAKFNSKITKEFINEYVQIFMSKRKYYEGPGTERDRTDYGIFRENGDTWTNITKNLIGKCSIYGDDENLSADDKRRAPKMSYTAQEFNMLNDLNNLKVGTDERKLSKEEKLSIINIVLKANTVNMKNIIAKVTGETKDTIKGFSISTDKKETFHKFEAYRTINKTVKSEFNIEDITKEEMNILADELSLNGKEYHIKEELLANEKLDNKKYTPEVIDCIINTAKKLKSKEVLGWHSLSYKAMEDIIDELYDTSKNQKQIFTERGLYDLKLKKYAGKHKIPIDDVLEDILSPVTKRSFNESIKIINDTIKEYGHLDGIVIEMARDIYKTDKELKNEQAKREKENKEIKKEIEDFCKTNGINFNTKFIGYKAIEKVKLWKSQNEVCLYSLRKITYETLMYDITGIKGGILEVDHIIPRSISFDNSLDNRVLVYRDENQKKGKRTPYQYISKDKWIEYEKFINNLPKINDKKKNLLTIKEDVTKMKVLSGFINRNLVDTSYACRSVLNVLQRYVKANNLPTKIYSVKGGFTNMVRTSLGLKKDRDYFKNHAEDATLVAFIPKLKIMDEYVALKNIYLNTTIKPGKGSILNDNEFVEMIMDSNLIKIKNEIINYDYKYRHRVDKKSNRQLTDDTFVSTRKIDGELYSVRKYKNIYGRDGEKVAKKIRDGKEKEISSLLVYKNDIKTYQILEEIVNQYPEEKNPFEKYKEEHGLIRKYSKKGNGPVVKSLLYTERRLGNCLDVSHKYGFEKGSKKVVLNGVNSFRVDIYYKDGQYKIVDIPYTMFKFEKGKYILNINEYNKKKIEKGVDDGYEFKFSIHKNSIVLISDKEEEKKLRYISIDVSSNRLGFKYTHTNLTGIGKNDDPIRITIGKSITSIKKINVDRLGNEYITEKENFKTEFKSLK